MLELIGNLKDYSSAFGEPSIALLRFIPMYVAYIIGISVSVIGFITYFIFLMKKRVLNNNK